ncbi:hypothetical protein LNAOJCKE_1344 [Methylorubrum aminovorans]|uniref:Uncharacterized protein n=1 Tax=Methylorubrum aminovorans TaxID=269069 RepID=A0ABQ4UAU6_9HYPH|nr:hypothetical protein LNAOJCKE_1344 [Methylorubrum aminovorans]
MLDLPVVGRALEVARDGGLRGPPDLDSDRALTADDVLDPALGPVPLAACHPHIAEVDRDLRGARVVGLDQPAARSLEQDLSRLDGIQVIEAAGLPLGEDPAGDAGALRGLLHVRRPEVEVALDDELARQPEALADSQPADDVEADVEVEDPFTRPHRMTRPSTRMAVGRRAHWHGAR